MAATTYKLIEWLKKRISEQVEIYTSMRKKEMQ